MTVVAIVVNIVLVLFVLAAVVGADVWAILTQRPEDGRPSVLYRRRRVPRRVGGVRYPLRLRSDRAAHRRVWVARQARRSPR